MWVDDGGLGEGDGVAGGLGRKRDAGLLVGVVPEVGLGEDGGRGRRRER